MGHLNNECVELSLLQCLQWMAIFRPYFMNNSTDWKSSVLEDLNSSHAVFPLCRYCIYTLNELIAINNVTTSTGIHAFPIICIWSWTNMPSILHMHVQLYYSCSLHMDPHITAHIIKKKNKSETTPCYCHVHANNKYAPQMPHKQCVHVEIQDNCISIYAPYDLTAINKVTMITGINTFYIIGIYGPS